MEVEKGVFLNGKEQVIEMMKYLDNDEKKRLLNHIRTKNPSMASELSERAVSFKNLFTLSNNEIKLIAAHFNPTVLGVAIRGCPINFQRKVLSSIERTQAESAYQAMTAHLSNELESNKKAQARVLEIALFLNRKKYINLN